LLNRKIKNKKMALFRAASLLGSLVIISQKNRDKLINFVVDPNNGKILGGIGKKTTFFIEDIKKEQTQNVITAHFLADEEKEDFLQALAEKIFLFKFKVETESGHYLGRIIDWEINNISRQVERVFVSDKVLFRALTSELQITKDDILSISKDLVIVRDGLVKRGALAEKGQSEYVSVGTGATLCK
jgi:sporulation protein YlmC with PRC-barrel domain